MYKCSVVVVVVAVFIDCMWHFDPTNNIESSSIQQMDSECDRMFNTFGPCTDRCLFCEHRSVSDWKQFWKILFVLPYVCMVVYVVIKWIR